MTELFIHPLGSYPSYTPCARHIPDYIIQMDQQFLQFLSALKAHQLVKGYHIQAFKKILLSQNLPPQFIGFMSNQLFVSNNSVFFYFQSSIKSQSKEQDEVRLIVYKLMSDFIKMRGGRLADYVQVIMVKFKEFYIQEMTDKLKNEALRVVGKVIKHTTQSGVIEEFLRPQEFGEFLLRQLKTCKMVPTLKGTLWYVVSIFYNVFHSAFEDAVRKQIQETILKQLQALIQTDKNLSTIARLVKSLGQTLNNNFLDPPRMNKYFRLLTILMIPLKSTYDVPKSALKALKKNASLFHSNILHQGKQIFQSILELMSHNNKQLKQVAAETLQSVNVEIVKGIFQNPERYSLLYNQIVGKLWDIIKQKIPNESSTEQKSESQAGKMATVLKVIGDLAPAIVQLSGGDQLELMFEKLIELLDSRTFRTFDISELEMNQAVSGKFDKSGSFVYLLYNQKLICSYLSAFGKIIPHISLLTYTQIQLLQKIWLLSIRQYPNYYQKYIPLLILSMTSFLTGFSSKPDIFQKWLHKMLLLSLKQTLDLNRFMISTNEDYYIVIRRAYEIWSSLLQQPNWKKEALSIFTETLFECFQLQLQTLDVSYKKTIEDLDDDNEIVNIFSGGGKLFQAVNVSQYQYMYSLTLVFQHLLDRLTPQFFAPRLYHFYMQILRKIKSFPKSIPLMKLCRCLNQYISKTYYFSEISEVEMNELIFTIDDVSSEIFHHLLTFENIFLYDSLKMLLSTPLEIIIHNDYRVLKSKMPIIIKKALDLGNEIQSLAYTSVKCLERLFLSREKKVVQRYLGDIINNLEKYLTYEQISEVAEENANLSLWELDITKVKMVDECLQFLGKLGGDAHYIVPNHESIENKAKFKNDILNLSESTQNSYIAWDYDAPLYFSIPLPNYTFDINIPKLLPRLCYLMVNSQSYNLKVTASELMHSIIIYLIGKSATNPNQNSSFEESKIHSFKKVAGKIYEKVLPFIFKVSCNIEHPSHQLMKTLSIHLVRFLSNTQQPDSPDVLVVISLLLQLLSYSQDISDFSSKCLVQLIKYNIKQNPNKQYPLFKMVMRNLWPLALSRRPGTITLLIEILKVIHRQNDLMTRYILQFYSLVLTLSKSNSTLSTQFKYLLEKLILITKKLIHTLKMTTKENSKFKSIYQVIDYLYTSGITSTFSQQREVSTILFEEILTKCEGELKLDLVGYLRKKSLNRNILFGTLFTITDFQVTTSDGILGECARLDARSEIWTKMSESPSFQRNQIINFIDFREIYLASAKNFFEFILGKEFREKLSSTISIEATNALLLSFLKIMNLIHVFLKRNDQHKVATVVTKEIEVSFIIRVLIIMFLKPQVILSRLNYDMFITEYKNSFKQIKKVFKIFVENDVFRELKGLLEGLFDYQGPTTALVQELIESNMFDMQLELYLKGQAEINAVLLDEEMSLLGKKWVDLEVKKVIQILVFQAETPLRENTSVMSKLKMRNLLTYTLSNPISRSLEFASKQLISNSKLFQTFEKQFIQFISKHWDLVGEEITLGYLTSVHISKTLFGLIKFLSSTQCARVGECLSLITSPRSNPSILEQELKINFFLVENTSMSPRYQQYLHSIIKAGMDPRQSLRVHESTLNLIGLLIQYNHWGSSDLPYFSRMLSDMVSIYLPLTSTSLKQQSQERYYKFLHIVKSFLVLCGNIEFFIPVLPIFFDSNKESSQDIIEELLLEYINTCFAPASPAEQSKQIKTVLEMFLDQNLDKEIINNKRILLPSILLKKMIARTTKVDTIVGIFNEYMGRLTPLLKLDQHVVSNQEFLIKIQAKKTAFNIFESIYRAIPPKRTNQQIHKHNHHKPLIIQANQTLKNQFKHQQLLTQLNRIQKYPFSVTGLLQDLWHSAYNLLIILFISTQKTKEHFKSYLFDRKQFRSNILWEHIVDPKRTDMGFEVITNFKVMKPVERICQPLKGKIQKRYMSHSLFVIDEEMVPKSQMEDAVRYDEVEFEEERQTKGLEQGLSEVSLELDVINKHPCMNNMLILVDFLTTFFDENGVRYVEPAGQWSQASNEKVSQSFEQGYYNRDQETPGWMKSIFDQLSNPDTPLSIQIFLLKLILNRPQIFRQGIWLPIFIKYLGLPQNGSKFFHYFYRDAAKQAITYIESGFRIEGKPVCLAINKMLSMLPHPQNPYLFSDNIYILQKMLEQKKVYIDEKIFIKIFNFEEGKENYLEWRMTGVIVLKMSLMCRVPILGSYEELLSVENSPERFKFILRVLEGDLRCIFRFFGESKQKYCIAAAGLVGQILRSIEDIASYNLAENVREKISLELVNIAKGKTRTQRQRFCLVINQISQIYPLVMEIPRVSSFLQDALFSVIARDKIYIFDSIRMYFEEKIRIGDQNCEILEEYCMTVKGCIDRVALDGPDVHRAFISSLHLLASSSYIHKPIILETLVAIYETLHKIFSPSTDKEVLQKFYTIVTILDTLTKTHKTLDSNALFKTNIRKSIIQALSSSFKEIRQLINIHFFKNTSRNILPPEKLLYLLDEFYIPSVQDLWLKTTVPLLLGMVKNSVFYDRIMFEEKLDNLAVHYDWDFRRGRGNHTSQPYTPAYIFNTQFVKREDVSSVVALNTLIATQSKIQKHEGMIKASYNYQEQAPIFTQPMGNSFFSPSFDQRSQVMKVEPSQPQFFNEIPKQKCKRSKEMSKFNASNSLVHDKFSVVNGNRLRFGNPDQTRKDKQYYKIKHSQILMQLNKKREKPPLLRKYKIGQLPDIQITGRDIVDPLLQLSSHDQQFSSQLLGILFQQICRKQKSSQPFITKFKQLATKITQSTTKYNFMFISTLQKLLIMFCKETEECIFVDMKRVADLSNSYDYSIIFVEENLIQLGNCVDLDEKVEIVHRGEKIVANRKERGQFLDLLDLYHKINENDNIPAILDKTLTVSIRNRLHQALKSKLSGNFNQSSQILLALGEEPHLEGRIKSFIAEEYMSCETLLGNWENLESTLHEKSLQTPLSKKQSKIYSLSLIASGKAITPESMKVIDYKKYNLFYQQALLSLCCRGITDTPKYLLMQQYHSFIDYYNRVSIFALQSKHELIEILQKAHELGEFLDLYEKIGISIQDCKEMFIEWGSRTPSAIHDSDETTFQILESRKRFAKMMLERFSIGDHLIIKNESDWLVQQAKIMLKRGSFGSAEIILKNALSIKQNVHYFSWPVYKAIGKLKLKQLMIEGNVKIQKNILNKFQLLPNLVQKEMSKSKNIIDQTFLELDLLRLKYYDTFLDLYEDKVRRVDCSKQLQKEYVEGIDKSFKILVGAYRNDLINTSNLSTSLFKIKRKILLSLTCFCQKVLSMIDGDKKIPGLIEPLKGINMGLETVIQLFGGGLIKSLNLIGFGESGANGNISNSDYKICFLILKFLKVTQLKPEIMGELLQEIVVERKIPIWIFLHFIPQIISTLSLPVGLYFEGLFMLIAEEYPEALIYQFNSQFEDRAQCLTPSSKNIYDFLHSKYPSHYTLIQALDSLNHPELRLMDALSMCLDKTCIADGIRDLQVLADVTDPYKGPYNRKFAQHWQKPIHVLIKDIQRKKNVSEDVKKMNAVLEDNTKIQDGYTKLSNFSLFFETYGSNDMDRFYLMTQPYKLAQQPFKESMIKIESFDQTILTLGSLRKPKKLTMFGNNQKKYSVLVKGGEDLRLDQRIQQIFDVINLILSKNVESENRQQFIKRYEAVPFRKSSGLIEWVDNTEVLKNFLEKQFCLVKNNYELDLFTKNDAYKERLRYLKTLTDEYGAYEIHLPLLSREEDEIVFNQNKVESFIPYGLLRRGIQKLSKSYDAFLYLKNRFISNYAVACAVSYILGIGDRHLENFLIHTQSATIVLIDFGRSFDYVLDLKMPELVPFRLSKSFRQLMEPVGLYGTFKVNLVHAFKAFRTNYSQILDFAQIFITDPILDWIKISRKKRTKVAVKHSAQTMSYKSLQLSKEQKDYFLMKIESVKKKLLGYNPRSLMIDTLKETLHKDKVYLPQLIKVISRGRQIESDEILTLENQTEELIQMSSDPNLIGRIYTGWQPWI